MRKTHWAILVSLVFMGCATTSHFDRFEDRRVDRPFVLPEKMTEFELNSGWSYSKGSSSYDFLQTLPVPFRWTHSLSDRLSLIWFVLPTGVVYQVINQPSSQVALEFFNHIEPPENPALSEYFSILYAYRLSNWVRLETKLGTQLRLLLKEGRTEQSGSIQAGPRWQLSSGVSLLPWLGVLTEAATELSASSLTSGLQVSSNISRALEVEANLSVVTLGYRLNRPQRVNGLLSLKYRW